MFVTTLRAETPTAPIEIQEAAELWARKRERHCKSVKYNPYMNCFCVEFTLKPGHPDLHLWREGKLRQANEPTESVPLFEWGEDGECIALDLEQLGASGLVELLEQGDVHSGRGENQSLTDGVEKAIQHNRKVRAEQRQRVRDVGQDMKDTHRRSLYGIPFVSVLADISPTHSPSTPT